MRYLLMLACLVLLPAAAEARPDSLRMSCAETAGLVQRNGAIVIGTGPNIFERFVTDRGFCRREQLTEPAWIPTADERQCLVGRRCIERPLRLRRSG